MTPDEEVTAVMDVAVAKSLEHTADNQSPSDQRYSHPSGFFLVGLVGGVWAEVTATKVTASKVRAKASRATSRWRMG